MGYTTCSRHNRKCCWRCDACPKCDGVVLLRGCYCVECTAKFKAEGAVWIPDYKNYISAEDYARAQQPRLDPALRACSDCDSYSPRSEMTQKTDGRVICKPCQSKVERITADRAQAALFDDQLTMF